MSTSTPLASIDLYFKDGGSDKEYHAQIESAGSELYVVKFQYGRRGSTLTHGTKTTTPVSLAKAHAVLEKLHREKVAKGYSPGEEGTRYHLTEKSERVTGLRPQLLNPLDDEELETFLANHYWAQEKHNGRRLQVRKRGDEIIGSNKLGLAIALPDPIVQAVRQLTPHDLDLDGEAVGHTLRCFELLHCGQDLSHLPYRDRYRALTELGLSEAGSGLQIVTTAYTPAEKRVLFQRLRTANAEGLVFKDPDAVYAPGRPSSGGPQRKYKFQAVASFLVLKRNVQRSVQIGLLDAAGQILSSGNVTIPANKSIPEVGAIIDVRYLYAMPSHHLHQPVYLDARGDVRREECRLTQLKYHLNPDSEEDDAA